MTMNRTPILPSRRALLAALCLGSVILSTASPAVAQGYPDRPIRIEAAAYKGKPVSFELLGPWSRLDRMHEPSRSTRQKAGEMIIVGLLLIVVIGGMVLARRNIRLGRGDRRGAFRLGLFILLCTLLPDVLFGKHVPAMPELGLLVLAVSWSLFYGAMTWLTYLALEPFVRRLWPDTIISWSRLIAGRIRDPLVGRDILLGATVGALVSTLGNLEPVVRGWVNGTPPMPRLLVTQNLLGFDRTLYGLLVLPAGVILSAIAFFFLLFLARLALRKDWLAVLACCMVIGANSMLQNDWVTALFEIPVLVAYFLVLLRCGLVAFASVSLFARMLQLFPITLDLSAWYLGQSILVLAVIAALLAYSFRIALASRPLFPGAGLAD